MGIADILRTREERQTGTVAQAIDFAGAARGIRTPDPIITNDVLYRLSYCGIRRDLGIGTRNVDADQRRSERL